MVKRAGTGSITLASVSRMLDKEMGDLVRSALEAGCTLERRAKHIALRLPDGSLQTIPSSRYGRSVHNTRASLRRRGIDI